MADVVRGKTGTICYYGIFKNQARAVIVCFFCGSALEMSRLGFLNPTLSAKSKFLMSASEPFCSLEMLYWPLVQFIASVFEPCEIPRLRYEEYLGQDHPYQKHAAYP